MNVDPARLARIKDKLLHAQNRLGLFMEWHTSGGEQIKDRLTSYKAISDSRALEAAQRLVPEVLEVIEEVDEWLSKQL